MTIDQFGKAIVASGLLTSEDVKAFWNGLAADARPKTDADFGKLLVERSLLTPFQVAELIAGRGDRLIMGDYTIVSQIGAGGMGQVYKAQHRRMKRTVALKVMSNAAMQDEAAVKRFQREVHAAARLEHPNIVTAYDSGEAGKVKYLVMQFVDGGDLSELIKKNGRLGVEQAVGYVIQAAKGLAFAHGEGVIHRDIKPANLLLDKKGVVKILDMGLARFEDGGDGLTATEQVMGTVDYMSPEQAANTKGCDGRADIYSLGCTLWYLLTAKKLYEADTLIARLMKHRDGELPSLVKERDDAPWPLEQALHKMIAKRMQDRYQTMDEVVAALAPFSGDASLGGSAGGSSPSVSHNADLASFMQSMGTGGAKSSPSATQVKPATNTNIDATAQFTSPEVGTDPKSQVLSKGIPSGQSAAATAAAKKPQTAKKKGKTGNNHTKLIGAGALGVVLLLAGIIVKIRDKDGNVVAEVNAPTGTNAEIITQPQPAVKPITSAIAPPTSNVAALLESPDYVWSAPENLGPVINGPGDQFLFSLTNDQHRLYFGRKGGADGRNDEVYEAVRPSLTAPFGKPKFVSNGSEVFVSGDGLAILVGSNDLTMRRRSTLDDPFGPLEQLDQVNTPTSLERRPTLSPDGLTLVFHTDRNPDMRADLWISRRKSQKESFGPAANIGPPVNTPGYEQIGTLLADNRTLVFVRSSDNDGWQMTTTNSLGKTVVVPLRSNPFGNTLNLWLAPDGRTAYFSADLPGGFGGKDIYVSRLVPKSGPTPSVPSFTSPIPATVAPIPATPATTIPTEALTFAGHRYLLSESFCTWSDAKAKAEAMGGHLATVNSKEERDWILTNVFQKRPRAGESERGVQMRLGGLIADAGGRWTWITGEPFDESLWLGSLPTVVEKCGLSWLAADNWLNVPTDNPNARAYYFLVEWDTPPAGPPTVDHALQFDGKTSHVTTPLLQSTNTPLTLEVTLLPGQFRGAIISDSEGRGMGLDVVDGAPNFLAYRNSGGKESYARASSPRTLEVDRTHRLAAVFDGAQVRLFVDGKLAATSDLTGEYLPSSFPFIIGASPEESGIDYPFSGTLDEVRFSKSARYVTDYTPPSRLEPDAETLALYHFDEGTGDVLKDSSGHGRDGKIVGAKWVKVDGASVPTAASVAPQSGAGPPLDLLPLVDLGQDILEGEWSKDGGGFVTKELKTNSWLRLPVEPGEAYKLRAAFSTDRGNVSFVLPFASKGLEIVLSTNRVVACLKQLNDPTNPTAVTPIAFNDAKRHETVIEVTRPSATDVKITVSVDGAPALQWQGTRSQLQSIDARQGLAPMLSVGSFLPVNSPMRLLEAQLTTTQGAVKLLRGATTNVDTPATVAAWLLENKKLAKIRIEIDGRIQYAPPVPTGPFKVLDLNFSRNNNAGQPLTEEEVARLAVFTDLESLELSTLTDAGLAKLVPLKKLKSLIVNGSELTPVAVATIRQFPLLEHLFAFGDDEWLKPLAGMPSLRSMTFWKVKVSSEAMSLFPQYPNLKELLFHECVEDEKVAKSFVSIAPLKDCKNLSKLSLAGSAVDGGELAVLSGFTQLLELHLNTPSLTETEVKQLAAALPRCKITWRDAANQPQVFEPTALPAASQTAAPAATSGKLFMHDPAFGQWLKDTASKSAEGQLAAVSKKLMELNPGFEGTVGSSLSRGVITGVPNVENGAVTELIFFTDHVADISPLKVLSGLRSLVCTGSNFKGVLADLSPLEGMQLTKLHLSGNGKLSDLSPLKGQPLTDLDLWSTNVSDLTPLKDMRLTKLNLRGIRPLKDLQPLKGMPLTDLDCVDVRQLSNLSPLEGMKLTSLKIAKTDVSDLSPLRRMSLDFLEADHTPITDLLPLKGMALTKIELSSCPNVSDLSPLQDCRSLENLNVKNTKITPAGVAALQKTLPNCKIVWDDPTNVTPAAGAK